MCTIVVIDSPMQSAIKDNKEALQFKHATCDSSIRTTLLTVLLGSIDVFSILIAIAKS